MVGRSAPGRKTISDESQAIFDCHTKASRLSAVAEMSLALDGSVTACPNVWLPHVTSFEKAQTS
jgi:hypothetical protein